MFSYSCPLPLHPLSLSWPPSAYPLPFSLPPSTHSPSLFPACFQFMSVSLTRWVITFMVGLFTGVVVSGIDYFIELLSGWKINTIKQSIHQHPSPSLYASCACTSDAWWNSSVSVTLAWVSLCYHIGHYPMQAMTHFLHSHNPQISDVSVAFGYLCNDDNDECSLRLLKCLKYGEGQSDWLTSLSE